jgi:hypothetical protein
MDITRIEADFARDAKRILDDMESDLDPLTLGAWTSDERHRAKHAEQWATGALRAILEGDHDAASDCASQSATLLEGLASATGRSGLRYLAIRLRGLEDRLTVLVAEIRAIEESFASPN